MNKGALKNQTHGMIKSCLELLQVLDVKESIA